jgi:hypothetical protein
MSRKKEKKTKKKKIIEKEIIEPLKKPVPKIIGLLPLIYIAIGLLPSSRIDPLSLCLALSLPCTILLMKIYGAQIPLYEKKGSLSTTGYDVLLLISSMILLLKAMSAYPLFSYTPLILCSMLLSVPLFIVLRPLTLALMKRWFDPLVIYALLACSVTNTTLFLNGALDFEKPKIYETTIQKKYTSKNRTSKSYKIEIQPWAWHTESEDKSVSLATYERLKVGDPIEILEYSGFFGMSWFKVGKLSSGPRSGPESIMD